MDVGERVYVETPDFKGMATIMYLANGATWPVQVELDNPVEGHKVYRVDYGEVKEQPKDLPQRHYAKVVRGRNGYRLGDTYIITKPGPNGYYSVYLKDRPHKGLIGSYITNFFEITGTYKERIIKDVVKPLKMPEIAKAAPPGINTLPKVETAEIEPKPPVKLGQLTIFDLLEG